jgi:hypothetical protein
MTPFQELRLWARRAPVRQRVSAATGALVVTAVLAWLLVPSSGDSPKNTVSAGNATGDTSATTLMLTAPDVTGSTVPTPSGAGAAGGTTVKKGSGGAAGATASPGGVFIPQPGCVSPPGSARGITGQQVKVGVGITELAGGLNNFFGIPDPAVQTADFEAVFADLNKNGGVACRKIVPTYYKIDPTSTSGMHQTCLDVAAAGQYAMIDTGSLGSVTTEPVQCLADHKVAYFGAYYLEKAFIQSVYPYAFTFYTYQALYHDTIYALKDRGFFSSVSAAHKLGFLYRSCYPDALAAFKADLKAVGIADANISGYDLGCPQVFAPVSDLQRAILQFQRDGVDHLTEANALGDWPNFTTAAQKQNFKPAYGLPDEALVSIAYGSQPPDADNMANAITVTESRDAEERTPGMTKTPGTVRCDNILKGAKQQGVYEQPAGAGNACDQVWMFQQALNHAPSVSPESLTTGLQRTKSIDWSYPQGPNDFTGNRVVTGGQFWRTAQFFRACSCWRLIDQNFHPSYP